jgi:hypothetical protein
VTHPLGIVQEALRLHRLGASQADISVRIGVNRSSVREWINDPERARRRGGSAPGPRCARCEPSGELDGQAYAYVLGLYLGDGCLSVQPNGVARLRIAQTASYPDLIAEALQAIQRVLPNRVNTVPRQGYSEIGSYSKHWLCLFPQHGPGPKHRRRIVLEGWQHDIVTSQTKAFLRGLVHSDGCRLTNRVRRNGQTYEYGRYQFTNYSTEIMEMFTDACDSLGVRWTRLGPHDVAVSRRKDVGFLDTFIGPKS